MFLANQSVEDKNANFTECSPQLQIIDILHEVPDVITMKTLEQCRL
jgi:hypothetical protein